MASYLAAQHLSRAIDAFSAEATERVLAEAGFVAERQAVYPGVAFIDLTGFTRLSEERGDQVAATIALQLGELARASAARARRSGREAARRRGAPAPARCRVGGRGDARPAPFAAGRRAAERSRRDPQRTAHRARGRRLRAIGQPGGAGLGRRAGRRDLRDRGGQGRDRWLRRPARARRPRSTSRASARSGCSGWSRAASPAARRDRREVAGCPRHLPGPDHISVRPSTWPSGSATSASWAFPSGLNFGMITDPPSAVALASVALMSSTVM